MANLFLLSRKAFVMCYCFRAPIKTFFFDTCQMTVKSCVLHLFPTGRSHTINILSASFFFGPYCKLREREAKRAGHKSMEKKNLANKRYVVDSKISA